MSPETPETPVAATPPTPENVAEMLTSGDNEEGTKLPEVHFRAVVVEGETAPIVAPPSVKPAFVNGDSGFALHCGDCEGHLVFIDAGDDLDMLVQARNAHRCPAEAAQAEQERAQ